MEAPPAQVTLPSSGTQITDDDAKESGFSRAVNPYDSSFHVLL